MTNDLRSYFFGLDADGRNAFAEACSTTKGHLQNVAYGYRPASPGLAILIERASAGEVAAGRTLNVPWTRIEDASWPHPAGRPCFDPAKAA